jgi:hypothetical protein
MNLTFEVNTKGWAEKLFFETCEFYPGRGPHEGVAFSGKEFVVANQNDWRFNHYNLIEDMLVQYSQKRFGSTATKLSYDNSGRRYDSVMDEICKGKCS